MGLRWILLFNTVFPISILADAVVEGRVQLPESHVAPVMTKRYEIVAVNYI